LAASKVWSGLTARWCRCSAMGLGRDVEAGMVSMAVWHGSERQRQCVRCGRVLSGGAVSSGQVVRRVQCGGSSGCMVAAWSEQCVAMWQSSGAVRSRGAMCSGPAGLRVAPSCVAPHLRGSSCGIWRASMATSHALVSLTQYTSLSPCNLPLLHR